IVAFCAGLIPASSAQAGFLNMGYAVYLSSDSKVDGTELGDETPALFFGSFDTSTGIELEPDVVLYPLLSLDIGIAGFGSFFSAATPGDFGVLLLGETPSFFPGIGIATLDGSKGIASSFFFTIPFVDAYHPAPAEYFVFLFNDFKTPFTIPLAGGF